MDRYRLNLLCLFVLFSVLTSVAAAQGISDMRLRANAGVVYEPAKKVELTARYRLTTHQDATVFLRSMFSLQVSYKLMKDLDAGAEYRYNTSYTNDFHRFFFFAKYKYGVGKFDLSYRLRYQQDQDNFNAGYLTEYPVERVFRNKLMVKYAYNKKCDVFLYADHFTELKNRSFYPYRVRYGVGIQYLYKKRHDITVEFFVNDEFNQKRPEDVAAIDVSYIYHLKKKGKKKKKSASN